MSKRDKTISKTIIRTDVLRREILKHCEVNNVIDYGNLEDNLFSGYYNKSKYVIPSDICQTVFEALEQKIINSKQTNTIAQMTANAICLKARILQDVHNIGQIKLGDWKKDATNEYLTGCIPSVQDLIWKEFDSREVDYDDYITELECIISFTIKVSEKLLDAYKEGLTV